MKIECPQCGSRNIRPSRAYTVGEHIGKALGLFKLRCRDCDARFSHTIWEFRNAIYARCPRCYRLDLTLWDTSHYRTSGWWRFLMQIGAKPRRCEACRTNFVSFRPAKAKYVRMRRASHA
jgi:hypothetical protein